MQTTPDNVSAPAASLQRLVRPICDRIREAWEPGIGYRTLMLRVFPDDHYPRAWRFQSSGGPPGCAMSFGAALRKVGLYRSADGTIIEGRPNEKLSHRAGDGGGAQDR